MFTVWVGLGRSWRWRGVLSVVKSRHTINVWRCLMMLHIYQLREEEGFRECVLRTQVGWETTCLNTHRISKFLKREMDTGYNYQLLSSMVKRGLHVCLVRGPRVESGTFTIPTTSTIFAQRPHAWSRGHGSEAIKQRAVYLHYTIVIVNSI